MVPATLTANRLDETDPGMAKGKVWYVNLSVRHTANAEDARYGVTRHYNPLWFTRVMVYFEQSEVDGAVFFVL